MSTPSHDEISQRAFRLWRESGSPANRDTEIWLTAERQLTAKAAAAGVPPSPEVKSEAQLEQTATAAAAQRMAEEHPLAPAEPEHDARAPHVPHHTGPHAKPAWKKSHPS